MDQRQIADCLTSIVYDPVLSRPLPQGGYAQILTSLILVFKKCEVDDTGTITIIDALASRIGQSVFIMADDLFDRIMANSLCYESVKLFNSIHSVKLFGSVCECSIPCDSTRSFLGKWPCSKIIEKIIILSQVVIKDVRSLIFYKMIYQ